VADPVEGRGPLGHDPAGRELAVATLAAANETEARSSLDETDG
jgi:hypothetical protein